MDSPVTLKPVCPGCCKHGARAGTGTAAGRC